MRESPNIHPDTLSRMTMLAIHVFKSMARPKTNDVVDRVDEMTRWEDDGGGNVSAEYEWLPLTSDQNRVQPKLRQKGS